MSTPNMAEVERLLEAYDREYASGGSVEDYDCARTTLLDYVRSALRDARAAASRPVGEICTDYHCPGDCGLEGAGYQHARQPVGEVDAVDGIPVPTGHAEADRLIGRLMSSDPDYGDCADAAALIQREIKGPDGFDTWREAALAERIKRTQQTVSAAEVPMPDVHDYGYHDSDIGWVETLACDESDVHTYGDTREAAGYARGKAENAKDAERYRWLRDGNDRKESAAMRIALHCYGMEWDAAIDAALRGEVKP